MLLLWVAGVVVRRRHERARRELSIENLRLVAELRRRRRVELGPEARGRRRMRRAAEEAAAASARGEAGSTAVAEG